MRTVLIINPTSGSSMMAETHSTSETNEEMILAALRTYGIEAEVWYTTPEDTGEGLAKKAANEHTDVVIAAGGDGTIHAVASGLIERESTLGIIPLGTMNNLAHSLGIPLPIEAACAIIAKGETRTIDVGKINGQTFIEVAGIGLEAALFPAAEEIKQSSILSTLRGVIGGLFTLFTFQTTKLKISFDNTKRRSYEAIQVTICNAPYYGAHFQVAPNILMDDGELDVVIYKNFSKREYIQHAISISQGRRVFQPKIMRRRVKSLRISAEYPVEIQADGLPHGHTPATVTITPGALRVRTPTANASGLRDEPLAEYGPSLQTSKRGQ
ncbi:MAG TPA: diacylglycerol kinase family protein [Ktedonobacteraceae bacterium]|nr:diacylglycerol kinase family protein [Ktedonobacteraceae bacterium]